MSKSETVSFPVFSVSPVSRSAAALRSFISFDAVFAEIFYERVDFFRKISSGGVGKGGLNFQRGAVFHVKYFSIAGLVRPRKKG